MKVSSRDLYKELRLVLSPIMKAAGFKTVKGGMPVWERPSQDGHLGVWFECDKWGWNARWGSSFAVGFTTFSQPGQGGKCVRNERLGYLLEGFDEYDQLRLRSNAVIARLPGTLNNQLVLGHTRDGRDYVIEGHRARTDPLVLGEDVWLNYYSLEDAQDWAAFFGAGLLRFVAIYEDGTRSELGQGRVRFNQALGAVQSLGMDQQARRLEILEQFIRDEPTEYWKSTGAFWLEEVRNKPGNV